MQEKWMSLFYMSRIRKWKAHYSEQKTLGATQLAIGNEFQGSLGTW